MRPRPEVLASAPVVHGGAPPGLVDFSVNSNPLGPAPAVLAACRAATIDRYPEPHAAPLRAALAATLGLAPDQVLVGNGSSELLWLLALAYLERGDRVLVVGPTFGEYARACQLLGAVVTELRAQADDAFQPDIAALVASARALRPKLTFLCNPNNPTGVYLPAKVVAALLDAVPGLLVLDEAYVDFVEAPWDARPLLADSRLVLLRSLTKSHALAGVRLGYALAAPATIAHLQAVQPPWSVNTVAIAAGLAAVEAGHHVAAGRRLARAAVAYLSDQLRGLGWAPRPTAANFLLVEVRDAAATTAALRQYGIQVRDCTSFGLPAYVRLGARPLGDCAALVAVAGRLATAEVV
ncbi:MAG: histidinol-phosphate aminotransferase family protein [Chloroflexi bacterium]|nr:histidinol-phosphate aminotransferase family protein [Chloroflexota bacterium]